MFEVGFEFEVFEFEVFEFEVFEVVQGVFLKISYFGVKSVI